MNNARQKLDRKPVAPASVKHHGLSDGEVSDWQNLSNRQQKKLRYVQYARAKELGTTDEFRAAGHSFKADGGNSNRNSRGKWSNRRERKPSKMNASGGRVCRAAGWTGTGAGDTVDKLRTDGDFSRIDYDRGQDKREEALRRERDTLQGTSEIYSGKNAITVYSQGHL